MGSCEERTAHFRAQDVTGEGALVSGVPSTCPVLSPTTGKVSRARGHIINTQDKTSGMPPSPGMPSSAQEQGKNEAATSQSSSGGAETSDPWAWQKRVCLQEGRPGRVMFGVSSPGAGVAVVAWGTGHACKHV